MATATASEIGKIARNVIAEEQRDTDEATLRAVQRLTKLVTEQVIPRLSEARPEEEPDPGATSAVSALAARGVITCNPAKLLAKARAHDQKASDYVDLWHRERNRPKPSRAKLAYYRKKSIAHERKAQQYRVKLRRCENADNQ